VARDSSGFLRQAQDRLFALERRAQDDSKNKQRIEAGNGERGKEAVGLHRSNLAAPQLATDVH